MEPNAVSRLVRRKVDGRNAHGDHDASASSRVKPTIIIFIIITIINFIIGDAHASRSPQRRPRELESDERYMYWAQRLDIYPAPYHIPPKARTGMIKCIYSI